MAKTQEELYELKKEFETLTSRLNELSEEELKQVTGGYGYSEYVQINSGLCVGCGVCADCCPAEAITKVS